MYIFPYISYSHKNLKLMFPEQLACVIAKKLVSVTVIFRILRKLPEYFVTTRMLWELWFLRWCHLDECMDDSDKTS